MGLSSVLYQHSQLLIIIMASIIMANITRNMKVSELFQKGHLELKEEQTHHHHHTNQLHMLLHHQSMPQLQTHTANQKRPSHHNHTNSNTVLPILTLEANSKPLRLKMTKELFLDHTPYPSRWPYPNRYLQG